MILASFIIPSFVSKEKEDHWNHPPSLESFLWFGVFEGENLLPVILESAQRSFTLSFLALFLSLAIGLVLIFFDFYEKTRPKVQAFFRGAIYFPRLFFLIFLSALCGLEKPSQLAYSTSFYLIVLMGVTGGIFLAAQTSVQVTQLRKQLFVYFASTLRQSPLRIFFQHILLNCTTLPLSITKQLRDNILFLSVLTFVGVVHLQPEDLGGLIYKLYSSPEAFYEGWWILFFPCAFLIFLILLFDLLSHHFLKK